MTDLTLDEYRGIFEEKLSEKLKKLALPSFLPTQWLSRRVVVKVTSLLIRDLKNQGLSDTQVREKIAQIFDEYKEKYLKEKKRDTKFNFYLDEPFTHNNILYFPLNLNGKRVAISYEVKDKKQAVIHIKIVQKF